MVADQSEVIEFLCAPDTYGVAGPVKRIDTHGAVVFLAGEHAYKLKRAVLFPFMDFSTIARRRDACEKEIEINRPNAPGIYLDAVPITRRNGRLQLDGDGEAVDWVVRMRRFDESQTLDRVADVAPLEPPLLAAVAQVIFQSHRRAPLRDGRAAAASLERYIAQNDEALRESPALFGADEVDRLTQAAKEAFNACRPLLIERGEAGLVRRCHGDLHLRNIALISGKPVLFDAIEFDDAIATCDVLYDLAFLLMDLWSRGLHQAANFVMNRYLWAAGEEAHLAGLKALPLFLGIRASLRAKIAAAAAPLQPRDRAGAMEDEARHYFKLAMGFLVGAPPRLVAIGGLSGTGKSTLAAALAPFIGTAPGAVILRSDIERKRLAGVPEKERLPAAAYTPAASAVVYETLNRKAHLVIEAGYSVILDAVHGQFPERNVVEGIASHAGVPFTGFWLDAPVPVMIQRVTERSNDASDADPAVVRAQVSHDLGLISWHRLDSTFTPAAVVDEALSILALKREAHAGPAAWGCGRACLEAAAFRARPLM
ncbi:bifunctional aminoglycoside phosphotransferase/ATP-binding protein [Labrys monachus]|uniref:Aminoglycoside phosphotransferase family enzyme/predicted kinase n=1 Tax=Labrys monachus TaxID=217067 RepID=A0ABU0F951_9HYPH|nr:bifunctional aminoglycoside phosphotransferase/ATP-binding protein [Labrys monachus]MDQ0391056.1 aminoglycoside phosphotransferase family enzyme/predicted kinase [Labrys monachus]